MGNKRRAGESSVYEGPMPWGLSLVIAVLKVSSLTGIWPNERKIKILEFTSTISSATRAKGFVVLLIKWALCHCFILLLGGMEYWIEGAWPFLPSPEDQMERKTEGELVSAMIYWMRLSPGIGKKLQSDESHRGHNVFPFHISRIVPPRLRIYLMREKLPWSNSNIHPVIMIQRYLLDSIKSWTMSEGYREPGRTRDDKWWIVPMIDLRSVATFYFDLAEGMDGPSVGLHRQESAYGSPLLQFGSAQVAAF
ncbi:hypothetical protein EDD17DRAFT_1514145 [Pisolithus thermaeus]|nr:hypothetical protein EV401DRAFT_2202634 [Pisolithus croceorrhizus]KAI6148953.1 hypothetical protein EDD17DRAFT_1514145 [Pisolithus thermaeus]